MEISVLLFESFETLDAFGPVEIFGRLTDSFTVGLYSEKGGIITSSQNIPVLTKPIAEMPDEDFLILIPGGIGTRTLLNNIPIIDFIKNKAAKAGYILSVCTGSVLLAQSGVLSGRSATTNKRVYNWVTQYGKDIKWVKKARWVKDGNIYTSSGVSAGIDMTLGFISDILGEKTAEQQSIEIEYIRNRNPEEDPFSAIYDL